MIYFVAYFWGWLRSLRAPLPKKSLCCKCWGTVAAPGAPGSEPGRGRKRPRLGETLGLQQIGHQERHLDRLLGIEPGIAEGVVAVVEPLVGDRPRPAGASRRRVRAVAAAAAMAGLTKWVRPP